MRRILKFGLALGAIVAILSQATLSFAGNPTDAANFSDAAYGTGFGQITGLSWGARGGNNYLFITNRSGQIYVIKNGGTQAGALTTVSPLWTGDSEDGIESILTDIDFGGGNPYVYIYITESTGSPGVARIYRYTFADNGTVSLSGKTPIGPQTTTHGVNHNGGGITQDSNGMIYAGVGNNGNGNNEGGNTLPPPSTTPNPNELTSLGSKIIRMDRAGNPQGAANFMAMTGNTRYIWARGMRNPFGLRIRPNSGDQLWLSEVGDSYEQIFQITENSNIGWPMENNTSTTNGLLRPKYDYNTGGPIGNALTRHVFYTGTSFPTSYQGSLFFCEYGQSRIFNLQMNGDNVVASSVTQFVTNAANPTDICVGPDGALYYGASGSGDVRRVSYNGSTPPTITAQPGNQTVNDGQSATFNVGANGTNLSYQWQVQAAGSTTWTNVGGNSSTYSVATNLGMNGSHYRVTVSNPAGSITSNGNALLTVNPNAIVIGTQPASQSVTAGTNATFSVTVTGGSAPITYQWQSRANAGGTFANIAGATNSSYTVTNTNTGMSGMQFQVIIDNPAPGTMTSNVATLTVTPANVAPSITTQPSNATVGAGATATFTVVAGGTNLTYQWQSRTNAGGTFTNVAGGTAATLSIPNTTTGMSGTQYQVIVSNNLGSVTSNTVTLTVTGPAAATPVIMPNGGTYSGPVTVTITTATAGATIHYTTNNTTPTAASATYNGPFVVSANATVQAIAIPSTSANSNSAVGSAVFTITGNVPYGLATRPIVSGITITSSAAGLPSLLSATGLFKAPVVNLSPSDGIIPFTVIDPLWSDGAVKKRWIALPGTAKIAFTATGEWTFPAGTIMIKHFELAGVKLETRVFYVNQAGGSYGATYKWNSGGTDADLLAGANPLDEQHGTQTWTYPSRADCLTCHNDAAKIVLGPKTRQLNGSYAYPGGATDNQIRTWNYLQMFTTTLNETAIPGYEKLVAVNDVNTSLENNVRSYLDSNCSNCHRPGAATGRAQWNGLYDTPLGSTGIVDGPVYADSLGLTNPKIVASGDPANSVLLQRMLSTTTPPRMPMLASHVVDTQATTTITAWINTLTPSGGGGGGGGGGGTGGGGTGGGAGGGAATTSTSSSNPHTGNHLCGVGTASQLPGWPLAAATALLLLGLGVKRLRQD